MTHLAIGVRTHSQKYSELPGDSVQKYEALAKARSDRRRETLLEEISALKVKRHRLSADAEAAEGASLGRMRLSACRFS